jgi:hypothetical protein
VAAADRATGEDCVDESVDPIDRDGVRSVPGSSV